MFGKGGRLTPESGYVMITLCMLLLVLSSMVWTMSRTVLAGNLSQVDRRDQDAARRYALAGRELVLRLTREHDSAATSGKWRTNAALGFYNITDSPVGRGKVTTKLVDPSGNFTDRKWETAVLYCTGMAGNAVYAFSEVLAPATSPVLLHGVFAGNDIDVRANTLAQGSVHANDDIFSSDNSRKLIGDGYAGDKILAKVTGDSYAKWGTLQIPAGDTSWYVAVGTAIPFNTLYKNKLFSPASNPYGPANPYGVYIITMTSDVEIEDCRVVGTLVFLKAAGRKIKVIDGSLIEERSPEQLVILVDGNSSTNLELGNSWDLELKEDNSPFVNFNPAGTPFPYIGGATDADGIDKYLSRVNGTVFCRGDIRLRSSKFTMRGSLVAGDVVQVRGHVGWNSSWQYIPRIGLEGLGLQSYGAFRQLI